VLIILVNNFLQKRRGRQKSKNMQDVLKNTKKEEKFHENCTRYIGAYLLLWKSPLQLFSLRSAPKIVSGEKELDRNLKVDNFAQILGRSVLQSVAELMTFTFF